MTQFAITILCLISLNAALSANILYIAPLASPSHYLWNKILALALVEKGHNVTILTHDTEKSVVPKNYTVITMEGIYEVLREHFDFDKAMHENTFLTLINMHNYVKFSCEYDLKTKGLETLLNYPNDFFDLIIFDVTYNQCLYPLIKVFNYPPVVGVTAFLLPPYLAHSFGSHRYTSYMPYYNSEFTNEMSLMQRVLNFVYTNADVFFRDFIISSTEYKLAKKRFGEDIPSFEKVERNISLLLANTDPNLDYPIPLPPNIIPIGGLHIKDARPLPKDIKQIVDNAKNGVILFSLGTNIMFSMLSQSQKEALFTALSRFPQTILWKIEIDDLKGVPKNVVVRKWLPQNDILGHPNTKLFITHGGALSTQEAIYHGVPVVTIPFIIDQYLNARRLVEKKFGRHLHHDNLTAENVYEAVKDVLDNPIYSENIKLVSRKYKDQPQTALERGLFWIEFILRHKTAEHLVTPARDMPLYKIANLDVLFILAIVLFCVYNFVMIVLTTIRSALVYFCSKNAEKNKTE